MPITLILRTLTHLLLLLLLENRLRWSINKFLPFLCVATIMWVTVSETLQSESRVLHTRFSAMGELLGATIVEFISRFMHMQC